METLNTNVHGSAVGEPDSARRALLEPRMPQTARGRRPRASAAHTQRQPDNVDRLARGLGWFSVALGAAELLAPRTLDRAVGAGVHPTATRLAGVREMGVGAALLTQPDPEPWLWSRVAGDVLDLLMLAAASPGAARGERGRLAGATLAVLGVTALDVYAARCASEQPRSAPGAMRRDGSVRVEHTLSVNRSPQDCYAMWRDFENLPRFMRHLESVRKLDERRSHWVAKAPAGTSVEWDAEITRDEPGALLSWRSIEGSEIDNAGAVRFLAGPAGRGALVSVTMQYRPPGGALGAAFAKLFGEEPEQQVRDDLRRFKQLLETGEIPTTEGQPHGQRPAWYRAMGGPQR
jgi:uncharacterized membrane protein